ncbi:RNA polymerase sigma factor [Filimonas effusa]|uniref:Sigma-70 family RNA polymerase sigma factor n=1 Tax=Filimonas effusa TaxID=2508721 RepID=A0A4Q1DDU9_9BACT|nr:sigma-70 family RNA polymerase sigma factor [Filimonas effusa]RXK87065.1 sigma-70 family RNA polymerase sigma factor [Filimonas effusa]
MSHHHAYNEKELLSRIAENDELAFAAFMMHHTDNLYSYILKITKSDHWAEELVQDVWLQVWQGRKDFKALSHPLAYLYRIAQNRSIDWIRRNKRELKAQYLIQQQLVPHSENSFISKENFETTRRLLAAGIEALPFQRRRIFELKQSGLSYDEIAATLNISKNTVRNQMVSALQALRYLLQQHGDSLILFFFYFFF